MVIVCIYVLLRAFLDKMAMGFDTVWLGVLVVLVMELALRTPPLGINMLIIRGIAPRIIDSDNCRRSAVLCAPLGANCSGYRSPINRNILARICAELVRVGTQRANRDTDQRVSLESDVRHNNSLGKLQGLFDLIHPSCFAISINLKCRSLNNVDAV